MDVFEIGRRRSAGCCSAGSPSSCRDRGAASGWRSSRPARSNICPSPLCRSPRPAIDRTVCRRLPLIARHEIVEAPSASVLATLRREAAGRAAPRRGVAVLADPVFDRADPRVVGTQPTGNERSVGVARDGAIGRGPGARRICHARLSGSMTFAGAAGSLACRSRGTRRTPSPRSQARTRLCERRTSRRVAPRCSGTRSKTTESCTSPRTA